MAKKIATPGNPVYKQTLASRKFPLKDSKHCLATSADQAEVEVIMEDKTDLKIGFLASPGSR